MIPEFTEQQIEQIVDETDPNFSCILPEHMHSNVEIFANVSYNGVVNVINFESFCNRWEEWVTTTSPGDYREQVIKGWGANIVNRLNAILNE